jgi:carboxylate-amine ligase
MSPQSSAPTFGIEEEFFLSDAASGLLREDAEQIRSKALKRVDEGVDHELRTAMLEIGTAVCHEREQARAELDRHRDAIRAAAAEADAEVLAVATHPRAPADSVDYTQDERYQRMAAAFGRLADEALVCGCHVHVRVASREEGVAVIDRVRGWLAPLIALSANSPFWEAADTGYDSWRHQVWSRWPSAGPTAAFGSLGEYERTADALVASGAALDRGMLYYDARLSEQWPTVEIRVADVCLDVDDALLIGVLARALVMTATAATDAPPPPVPVAMLRAAGFVASRFGVRAQLLDPATAWQPAPAAAVMRSLVDHVTAALEATGDREFVTEGVDRLLRDGNGASRQRAAMERGGEDAVRKLVRLD